MKNFMPGILAAAFIATFLSSMSFPAAAQNGSSVAPNPTAAVPPVTIEAPAAASPTPAPAASSGQPVTASQPPLTQHLPTHKKKLVKKHVVKKSHHVHKKMQHKVSNKSAVSTLHERTRTAQADLEILNYTPGPVDGLMGPKTRAALKVFQKDNGFKVTGKLDNKTYDLLVSDALDAAKKKEPAPQMTDLQNGGEVPPGPKPTPDFYVKHPDYYGYTNREYTNPTELGSPQSIPTRFGDMAIDDHMTGTIHEYSITINGHPVFRAEGQPSVINLSRTFSLDEADALVLTSYAENDTTCPYRHYLLVIRLNSNGVHEIGNCTRAFEAYTQNGALYITFPGDHVDGWSSGDTWRYENGTMQRL